MCKTSFVSPEQPLSCYTSLGDVFSVHSLLYMLLVWVPRESLPVKQL